MSQWPGSSYEEGRPSQALLHQVQSKPAPPDRNALAPRGEDSWVSDEREQVTEVTKGDSDTSTTLPASPPNRPTSADLMASTQTVARPLATEGWRAKISTLTFGLIKPAAGPQEIARLVDIRDAGIQLSRPMTVMVANIKGGVGKTPTSMMLSAQLGLCRGGGVVAWDNNENQGTLGIRAEAGRFQTTTLDLLRDLPRFEAGAGRLGDLGRYVRPQQSGHFDVLASAEDSRYMTAIGKDEFERIHKVLSTFYQLIVVDTGNALLAPNWGAAADRADVLVVPIRWQQDHVLSASRMFDQLIESGREDLVRSAITVISHAPGEYVDRQSAPKWRSWFEASTAAVLDVPSDPHIAAGGAMRYDRLAEGTQRAYLAVAAEVSRRLTRVDTPHHTKGTN